MVAIPYAKKGQEGKLLQFSWFSLNRECFPMNYGLVDWKCKSTSMLAHKFPANANYVR